MMRALYHDTHFRQKARVTPWPLRSWMNTSACRLYLLSDILFPNEFKVSILALTHSCLDPSSFLPITLLK
jgi:hypothetical protein